MSIKIDVICINSRKHLKSLFFSEAPQIGDLITIVENGQNHQWKVVARHFDLHLWGHMSVSRVMVAWDHV